MKPMEMSVQLLKAELIETILFELKALVENAKQNLSNFLTK